MSRKKEWKGRRKKEFRWRIKGVVTCKEEMRTVKMKSGESKVRKEKRRGREEEID